MTLPSHVIKILSLSEENSARCLLCHCKSFLKILPFLLCAFPIMDHNCFLIGFLYIPSIFSEVMGQSLNLHIKTRSDYFLKLLKETKQENLLHFITICWQTAQGITLQHHANAELRESAFENL